MVNYVDVERGTEEKRVKNKMDGKGDYFESSTIHLMLRKVTESVAEENKTKKKRKRKVLKMSTPNDR